MSSHILSPGCGTPMERLWPGRGGRTAGGYEKSALILTADEQACENLAPALTECGFEPVRLGSVGELRMGALDGRAALLLCEQFLPDGDFRDVLRVLTVAAKKIPVIVFSRIADWDSYLQAMRLGAYDCLRYPFRCGELQRILRQIIRAQHTNA
jgi:DNA-binding NtrC family response regulator